MNLKLLFIPLKYLSFYNEEFKINRKEAKNAKKNIDKLSYIIIGACETQRGYQENCL